MDLRMGIYRHYKGQLYQVLSLASDANARPAPPKQWEASSLEEGWRSRFDYLGPVLTEEMLP